MPRVLDCHCLLRQQFERIHSQGSLDFRKQLVLLPANVGVQQSSDAHGERLRGLLQEFLYQLCNFVVVFFQLVQTNGGKRQRRQYSVFVGEVN